MALERKRKEYAELGVVVAVFGLCILPRTGNVRFSGKAGFGAEAITFQLELGASALGAQTAGV